MPPDSPQNNVPPPAAVPPATKSWLDSDLPVLLWFAAFVVLTVVLVFVARFAGQKVTSTLAQPQNVTPRVAPAPASNGTMQAEAEELLQRAAGDDAAASEQILARSGKWVGTTQRTPRSTQLITTALNSRDLQVREAAVQAQLALDGVRWDETGLNSLQQAVAIPNQRVWALWTLGALGNRGVDPDRAAKIIGSYLSDPEVNVRVSAVNGLALLGSDETVPMLLDRFRNDPSPVVQEQAACGVAQSGMYTHEQRMVAASLMVNWLDDPQLTPQQKTWTLQALRDISGQNMGTDSAEWRQWYESQR